MLKDNLLCLANKQLKFILIDKGMNLRIIISFKIPGSKVNKYLYVQKLIHKYFFIFVNSKIYS